MDFTFLQIEFANGTTITNPNNAKLEEFFESFDDIDDIVCRMGTGRETSSSKMDPGEMYSNVKLSGYMFGKTAKYIVAFSGREKKLILLDTQDRCPYVFECNGRSERFHRSNTPGNVHVLAEMRKLRNKMPATARDIQQSTQTKDAGEKEALQAELEENRAKAAAEREALLAQIRRNRAEMEAMGAQLDAQLVELQGDAVQAEARTLSRITAFATKFTSDLNSVKGMVSSLQDHFYAWVIIIFIVIVAISYWVNGNISNLNTQVAGLGADLVRVRTDLEGIKYTVGDNNRRIDRFEDRDRMNSQLQLPSSSQTSQNQQTDLPPAATSSWNFGYWSIVIYPLLITGLFNISMIYEIIHEILADIVA